jgi:hypothetical protein
LGISANAECSSNDLLEAIDLTTPSRISEIFRSFVGIRRQYVARRWLKSFCVTGGIRDSPCETPPRTLVAFGRFAVEAQAPASQAYQN